MSKVIYSGQRTLRKFKNHRKKSSENTTEEMMNIINETEPKQNGAQSTSNKISSLLGSVSGPPPSQSFNNMSQMPHSELEQGMEIGNNPRMSPFMSNPSMSPFMSNPSMSSLMGNSMAMSNLSEQLTGNSMTMGNSMGNPLMGNSMAMGNPLMGNSMSNSMGNSLMGNSMANPMGSQMSSFLGSPKHAPSQFVPPTNHMGLDNKIQINPF